jgi:hypothetical protein
MDVRKKSRVFCSLVWRGREALGACNRGEPGYNGPLPQE